MDQIVVGPRSRCQLPGFDCPSHGAFGALFATLCQSAAELNLRVALFSPHDKCGWGITMRHDIKAGNPLVYATGLSLSMTLEMAFDKLAKLKDDRCIIIEYQYNGTYAKSRDHKASLRLAARKRASTSYRHISVDGVVYANLVRASEAVKLSPRTLHRYALSDRPEHQHYFFVDEGVS